jgi:hypothetical protein
MSFPTKFLVSLCVCLVVLSSCGEKQKEPPPRDVVEKLLQEEAQSMKRDGEQVNPSLGVKVTWDIESVEVREQAGADSKTWAGTLRFQITSEQKEYDGSDVTNRFEKVLDYLWDLDNERWVIQ